LSQVKNIKGSLHAAIDPKMNHFLVKTQKNLMEAQPLMKKLYKEFKAAATLL